MQGVGWLGLIDGGAGCGVARPCGWLEVQGVGWLGLLDGGAGCGVARPCGWLEVQGVGWLGLLKGCAGCGVTRPSGWRWMVVPRWGCRPCWRRWVVCRDLWPVHRPAARMFGYTPPSSHRLPSSPAEYVTRKSSIPLKIKGLTRFIRTQIIPSLL